MLTITKIEEDYDSEFNCHYKNYYLSNGQIIIGSHREIHFNSLALVADSESAVKSAIKKLDKLQEATISFDENEKKIKGKQRRNWTVQEINFEYEHAGELSPLKIARERAGLSQSELADKAGISIRTLQSYEQEQRDISKASVETLQKLTVALNCLVEDLIC